ncbi:conjugal transfer protein TraG N-terminal domain-containing protein [Campylobacter sp. MIT 97-5078]|uniref:conjugal transfer protein TraG N-terminal domain-containing protein n=1 Tax=Campylobacter sp. MIT 97-5078 TaxID=1548153 RepID=UPI00068CC973|nr:conjugal transfer protein TraG N-terminal domain-containing protein [Campylobacter sp. MIT 97-5078]
MFKKLIFCNALLLFPASVFAATNIPDSQLIYTWGYGNIMNDMLQAVKGMTTEADYIIKAAMTIAFFIFAIQKAMGDRTSPIFEFGKFLLLYAVVYFFFLSPANTSKNQFMIHDEVTNKDYVVSRVPMGIGYTLSLMSRFEKVLLDGMEKHFSTPDSTAYSQAGLGFSLNAMMDLPTLRIQKTNPDVQLNINAYVKNCLQYDTLSGKISINDIHTSDELINVLFPTTNSKLTVYYENNNGQMNDSLISCGESAQNLKRDIAQVAGAREAVEAHIANVGTVTEWRNKFNGVSQIYFGQAKGAREQIQQMVLINALDDGINNTASVLGIDPNSLAANAAVAEQSYVTGMQAQGKLAQTYLPIAKAYLTAIIVGLSWLMAILSIMFGSYQYIKMFFVLCLSLVLWTPILSIINYLNDLTLQHTFAFVNAGVGAITYANYQEVFQAVTSHSSYLKYLVMLTPLLAFSLAKGSEMGFVSLASGLSQQLAGSARSASSFSTQQGLSTRSEISSADGSMTSSLYAGRKEDVYASDTGGSFVQMSNVSNFGGYGANASVSTVANSKGVLNSDGSVGLGDVSTISTSAMNSESQTRLSSITNSANSYFSTDEGRQFLSDFMSSTGSSSSRAKGFGFGDNTSIQSTESSSSGKGDSTTYHDQTNVNTAFSGGVGINPKGDRGASGANVGINGSINESMGKNIQNTENVSENNTHSGGKSYTYTENDVANLMQDKAFRAAFGNHLSTSESKGAQELKSQLDSFTALESFSKQYGTNTETQMVQNYMNEHNLQGNQGLAQALVALEQAGARGDFETLGHYAGMKNNESINASGLEKPDMKNHLNYDKVAGEYSQNAGSAKFQSSFGVDKNGNIVQGALTREHSQNSDDIAFQNGGKAANLSNLGGKTDTAAQFKDIGSQKSIGAGRSSFSTGKNLDRGIF